MEGKLEKMKFIPQPIRLTEAGKYESMLKKCRKSIRSVVEHRVSVSTALLMF